MRPAHERSFAWRLVSPLAWPFVLLYAMVVRLKNAAYDLRLVKPYRLASPVLSVGNLSVGGTGKTPVVLLLASLLQARGWTVDVLSRGYGRSSSQIAGVDPAGDAATFGDEPLLMSRDGVAVYVGADRYQAGLMAESQLSTKTLASRQRRLHILDDGCQHRRLVRAVDIVLLHRADLADEMLPLGRLREPLSALERADICVLRSQDADLKDRVLHLMRQRDPARVWIVERRMIFPPQTIGKAVAFCGLADPREFFAGVRAVAVHVEREISFRDHHSYTQRDIDRLKIAARNSGAQCFVTTEKDAVRLHADLRAQLEEEFPLIIARLEVSLRDETGAISTLESLLAASLQIQPSNVR